MEKICVICGKHFNADRHSKMCCSAECARIKARQTRWKGYVPKTKLERQVQFLPGIDASGVSMIPRPGPYQSPGAKNGGNGPGSRTQKFRFKQGINPQAKKEMKIYGKGRYLQRRKTSPCRR